MVAAVPLDSRMAEVGPQPRSRDVRIAGDAAMPVEAAVATAIPLTVVPVVAMDAATEEAMTRAGVVLRPMGRSRHRGRKKGRRSR